MQAFLAGNDSTGVPPAAYRHGEAAEVRIDAAEKIDAVLAAKMMTSRAKLTRMAEQLAAVGFVSFVQ